MAALARLLIAVATALGTHGPTTAGNRLAAQRDAQSLLGRVVLPAGARRLAKAPGGAGGLLGRPFQMPGGKLVDRNRLWRVPESFDSVVAFVKAHPPPGAQREGSGYGSSEGPHYPRNETFTFAFPARSGRISLRWLNVTLVAQRDGTTGVRADAQEIWIVTRPRREVVPPGVREIDVGSRRVTGSAQVTTIVRWFDALPIVQPDSNFSCPALTVGPEVRLVFRSAAGVLARASFGADTMNQSLVSTPCTPIRFTIGGRVEKPLVGGTFFLRVQRLLGTKLR